MGCDLSYLDSFHRRLDRPTKATMSTELAIPDRLLGAQQHVAAYVLTTHVLSTPVLETYALALTTYMLRGGQYRGSRPLTGQRRCIQAVSATAGDGHLQPAVVPRALVARRRSD